MRKSENSMAKPSPAITDLAYPIQCSNPATVPVQKWTNVFGLYGLVAAVGDEPKGFCGH